MIGLPIMDNYKMQNNKFIQNTETILFRKNKIILRKLYNPNIQSKSNIIVTP